MIIMENSGYREAFRYIYENYKELVEKTIPQHKKALIDHLNSIHVPCREDGGYLWIGNRGVGISSDEAEALKDEISSEKYESMLKSLL